jgi:hypothetical protein
MFSTLIAQHLQLGALEAAAKVALSDEEYDVFKAAATATNRVQTPRNHLAHWIWASCPELPDALLLADPKAAKERDREFLLALERYDTQGMNAAETAALNNYDASKVLVCREGDLARANRDLEEASLTAFLVVIYLDGLFRGRRKPSDLSQARMTRAQVFQQLCSGEGLACHSSHRRWCTWRPSRSTSRSGRGCRRGNNGTAAEGRSQRQSACGKAPTPGPRWSWRLCLPRWRCRLR